jgi:2-polyprenyl-6-hydroxyphenyl methylase/3-demethylubiquinone-9 3-methyltransferase
MWQACENVVDLVAPGGALFISIYNDQGIASRAWRRVKRAYVEGGPVLRRLILVGAAVRLYLPSWLVSVVRWGRRDATRRARGMSRRHDLVDWVGGYPFEVARPEQVFDFFRARGFQLDRLITCGGGLGCNQFVFRRR